MLWEHQSKGHGMNTLKVKLVNCKAFNTWLCDSDGCMWVDYCHGDKYCMMAHWSKQWQTPLWVECSESVSKENLKCHRTFWHKWEWLFNISDKQDAKTGCSLEGPAAPLASLCLQKCCFVSCCWCFCCCSEAAEPLLHQTFIFLLF